jgi:hypothetical protein
MTHTAINSHSLGEQRASEYWDDTNYCTKHWGEETQAFGQCEHGFSDAQNNMLDAYLGEEQQDEGNAMYSNSQKCTFKQVAYAERNKENLVTLSADVSAVVKNFILSITLANLSRGPPGPQGPQGPPAGDTTPA